MEENRISGQEIYRFDDISILRYKALGFENLSLKQKLFIYHLSEASIWGRDIITDQNGVYNLRIRKVLESVYQNFEGDKNSSDFIELKKYLSKIYFSNGIHHHYSGDKFEPNFSREFLEREISRLRNEKMLLLFLDDKERKELLDVIFIPELESKRSQQSGDKDLLLSSSMNMYQKGIKVEEVEAYYKDRQASASDDERNISWGLNSYLAKDANGDLHEITYSQSSLYGEAIKKIISSLSSALAYAENEKQELIIKKLIDFYKTGSLKTFDEYSIDWVKETELNIDFINGFIETYTDPIAMRAAWESIIHLKDEEASRRSKIIVDNAKWFEQNSPIDEEYKKENPKGISATVVNVMMLGGDSYPATPIGVNLPNADWIRAEYGSKSISIENIHYAYDIASENSGLLDLFVKDESTRNLIRKYNHITDRLHTDMHECLGHGSGKLAEGVSSEALGAYHSVIEETRADLFALYFMADDKLLDLGLLDSKDAYKACYYQYILNGKITQLARIKKGKDIEEAHMRNRALIANYILENLDNNIIQLIGTDLHIYDYEAIRIKIAELLREIQRIKSEGDIEAAKNIIEKYAIKIDQVLHEKVIAMYNTLNISPYKGFINPRYSLQMKDYEIVDVIATYEEGYLEQMMRYSKDYSILPLNPTKEILLSKPLPLSPALMSNAKFLREELRKSMDGEVARSMREKGMNYGINFGLTKHYIDRLSEKVPASYDLAIYLMSRDVRELKILATKLLPAEELDYTTATYLAKFTASNVELRDLLAMNLFDRNTYSVEWALSWLKDDPDIEELSTIAYICISRHIYKGYQFENPIFENFLLSTAIKSIDESEDFISQKSNAALLLLRRWGQRSNDIKDRILLEINRLDWSNSNNSIKKECADDLIFSFSNF